MKTGLYPPLLRRMVLLGLAVLAFTRSPVWSEDDLLPSAESRIVWEPDLRVKRSERVFASPHDAFRVLVCAPQGIMETLDDGVSWNPLPNSGREQLGRVSDLLFSPVNANVLLLASRDKGVFRSNDNGKTWQSVGTVERGLKTLHVVRLGCSSYDRSGRTFYAAHGDAALGMSKTVDGGATWFTIAENMYIEELLTEGREVLMAGHSKQEQDLWSVYQSHDGGQSWLEVVRDIRPTVSGVSRSLVGSAWFGVLKGRLLHRPPPKREDEWSQVGPDEGAWASIFSTVGRKADMDVMYAYDPFKHGLVASKNNFKTWWPENKGLFVGRLVKDGANICTTANGKSFYASINSQLYIGRLMGSEGPTFSHFNVSPPIVSFAESAKVTFTARVAPLDKDPKSQLKLVQVNLTPVKGPPHLDLLDDGQHGDGAANDGLYANTYEMKGDLLKDWWTPEKRWGLPGMVMLDIFAKDGKNRLATEKLPFSVYAKPETAVFWNGDEVRWGSRMADARRAPAVGRFDSRNGIIFEIEEEAHAGQRCLHVVALRGPWITGWGQEHQGKNVTDASHLSFWIKASCATRRDLKVLLTDTPGGENDARHSDAVWLIKDGFLKELTTVYQRVRIPVPRLAGRTGFYLDLCGGIAFGGDDPNGHNFYVDDIAFEAE